MWQLPEKYCNILVFLQEWLKAGGVQVEGNPTVARELSEFLNRVAQCGAPYQQWCDDLRAQLNITVRPPSSYTDPACETGCSFFFLSYNQIYVLSQSIKTAQGHNTQDNFESFINVLGCHLIVLHYHERQPWYKEFTILFITWVPKRYIMWIIDDLVWHECQKFVSQTVYVWTFSLDRVDGSVFYLRSLMAVTTKKRVLNR